MINEKPCKGQHKANGAKSCGKITDVKKRKFGLCPACLYSWMKNTEPGKLYHQKTFSPKVKKGIVKNKKARTRKQREDLKSIALLIQEARKPFQKFIRLRDINRSCISCNDVNAEIWQGGHCFKAEIFTGLIFDEANVHKQCKKCNTYLGGNEASYLKGLLKRYGEAYVMRLTDKANASRQYKFSRDELYEIKSYYQKKVREFEQSQK